LLTDQHGTHDVLRDHVVNGASIGLAKTVGEIAKIQRSGDTVVLEAKVRLDDGTAVIEPGMSVTLQERQSITFTAHMQMLSADQTGWFKVTVPGDAVEEARFWERSATTTGVESCAVVRELSRTAS
jgi:hypothetical protein